MCRIREIVAQSLYLDINYNSGTSDWIVPHYFIFIHLLIQLSKDLFCGRFAEFVFFFVSTIHSYISELHEAEFNIFLHPEDGCKRLFISICTYIPKLQFVTFRKSLIFTFHDLSISNQLDARLYGHSYHLQ